MRPTSFFIGLAIVLCILITGCIQAQPEITDELGVSGSSVNPLNRSQSDTPHQNFSRDSKSESSLHWISIDSIKDHKTGERFNITGITNLSVGDEILVTVYPFSLRSGSQCQCSDQFYGATATIPVLGNNSGTNQWIFMIWTDNPPWKAGKYRVQVTAVLSDAEAESSFNLTES